MRKQPPAFYSHHIDPFDSKCTVVTVRKISGRLHDYVLPIAVLDFENGLKAYADGALIQDAFPTLDKADRELLLSGMTDDEWNAEFSQDRILTSADK